MNTINFKLRSSILLIIFLIWSIILLCKIFSCSVLKRPDLLRQTVRLAWREGSLPAQRGRILDKNGKILAKDRLRCALIMDYYPLHPERERRLLHKLRIMDPGFSIDHRQIVFPHVIKTDLTLEEIREYRRLFLGNPEVRVQGYFERDTNPELETLLGNTAINDKKESVGISGLEKTHDMTLSGKSGQFVVMLDRQGKWVNDTLRIIVQPVNGQDIRLKQSTEELLAHE